MVLLSNPIDYGASQVTVGLSAQAMHHATHGIATSLNLDELFQAESLDQLSDHDTPETSVGSKTGEGELDDNGELQAA